MTDALRHRGPDGAGFYEDESVSLGHRRLAIIDAQGGRQPMADRSARFRLVYNGEVYNHLELRRELEEQGEHFITHSDVEVVLACLAKHGTDALDKFDGMFALALWDCERRRLLLARDRIGIKPLYYSRDGSDVFFASEIKSLLLHPRASRRLSHPSVAKYFAYGYVPAPNTILKGVYKLEAGHYVEIDATGIRDEIYADIPGGTGHAAVRSLPECISELRRLLDNAVRRQLRSDVPVGVLLSGGVDSSTIATLAAVQSSTPLHTFSIGFDDPSHDESQYARSVSTLLGTSHHEKILTLQEATGVFPAVVAAMDEPLADASLIPSHVLAGLAARQVKVVLGGEGGDEIFQGYPAFLAHRLARLLSRLPAVGPDWVQKVGDRLAVSHDYASASYLLRLFSKGARQSDEVRFLLWLGFYDDFERNELLSEDLKQELRGHDIFEDVARFVKQCGSADTMRRLEYLCMKLYFQADILAKLDTAGMANSLEVRVPFMDQALVDFACRLPPNYKLRGLTSKYILKRMAAEFLPRRIVRRRKAGFMMPVARWLTTHMRDALESLCAPAALTATGLLNPAFIRRMMDEHFELRRDHRKNLYALLSFLAWMRHNNLS
jgi:asparagine synthase (glutamine-hydrolysing)